MITPEQAAQKHAAANAQAYAALVPLIDEQLASYDGVSIREVTIDMTGVSRAVKAIVRDEYGRHWDITERIDHFTFSAKGDADAHYKK